MLSIWFPSWLESGTFYSPSVFIDIAHYKMPPRLNKRQQRELEELEALGGSSKQEVSSEDEQPIARGTVGGFSNVGCLPSPLEEVDLNF